MSINSIQKIYQRQPTGSNIYKPSKTQETPSITKENNVSDSITISSQASFSAKIDNKIKQFEVTTNQRERAFSERIAELKIKYKGDNCPVSSTDVADAMMNKVWGDCR